MARVSDCFGCTVNRRDASVLDSNAAQLEEEDMGRSVRLVMVVAPPCNTLAVVDQSNIQALVEEDALMRRM